MKLLVISQSLIAGPSYRSRWYRLAATYPDLQIRLLIPKRWKDKGFGKDRVLYGHPESRGNLDIRPVQLTNETSTGTYLVRGLAKEIRDFSPDVIFPVHENWQLAQTIILRRLYAPKARLIFFAMSAWPRAYSVGFDVRLHRTILRLINLWVWRMEKRSTDGAVCHIPDIEQRMRLDGYRGPLLVQTQIGVDEELFRPDSASREIVRAKLGLNGFVVGFAGRVEPLKGVLDIGTAMASLPRDCRLLVVGDGVSRGDLEKMASNAGWRDRLHITGFVPPEEVSHLMRAMDCFVLGSRTTVTNRDNFPLVVVQAMATGIPVICSDSGGLPFQLGGRGLVFHEGDHSTISAHILKLHSDRSFREKMAHALLQRARSEFCISGMNPKLYNFIMAIMSKAGPS